jgi:hypothetical protein
MPTVATYYQLQDEDVELGAGGPTSKTFTQNVGVAPAGQEGALVSWMAASKTTDSVEYTVTLNNVQLNEYTESSVEPGAMQEATTVSNVNQGNNTLVFQVTGGSGTLVVSDVMLWHRVNV